jgi:DNA-directed RNA polymerase subunit omega
MARVTIEDCLGHVDNMYELVHVATRRARQLYSGGQRTVRCKNKEVVCALREIAAGHIFVGEETDGTQPQT